MTGRINPEWQKQLAPVWESAAFAKTADFIRREYSVAKVYPPESQIFAAFDLCPFSAVKVVILGQDPYHGEGQANGEAFSVNEVIAVPPSLVNI